MKTPKLILIFLAAALCAVSLHGQGAIVATDEMLATGNYTHQGEGTSNVAIDRDASGNHGLQARVGSHYLRFGGGFTERRAFSARLTNGFLSGHVITAGEYTATIDVGRNGEVLGRDSYEEFEFYLITLDGTEIGERTVVVPYTEQPDFGQWTTVEIRYTVEEGSPVIGQTLTWSMFGAFADGRDVGAFGPVDNVIVTLTESGNWVEDFSPIDAPIALNFGTGAGQDGQNDLLRNWPQDYSIQANSLRYQPALETFVTSTALASVSNYIERQNFTLEADMNLTNLGGLANNRVGLVALGGPHSVEAPFNSSNDTDFYALAWEPSGPNGESVLSIRNGFNGPVLAQNAWGGRAPLAAEEVLFSDDFENASASESAWTVGGSPSDFWQIGEPVFIEGTHEGPESAFEGNNVAGTGLAQNYPANTNAWIRTPAINLNGMQLATLRFHEYTDLDDEADGDNLWHNLNVEVRDASSESLLATLGQYNDVSNGWRSREFSLPANALNRTVVIIFRLESDPLSGDEFPGWFIDNVSVAGTPTGDTGQIALKAEGIYDLGGSLELIFTMTDEDDFSASVSTFISNPLTGNLFGVGGRARTQENATFDFETMALTLGDEPAPIVPSIEAPFSYAFGSGDGRNAGGDFLQHPEGDWSLTEDALRLATSAANYENAIATTRVYNFEPGNDIYLTANVTLDSLDSGDADNRAGLVLFGAEDPNVYDPTDDSSFYTFQWLPNAAGGGLIAVRQGMDGAIIAQTQFSEVANPPAAVPGNTYNFRFLAQFNGGNIDFTAVVSDGVGGAAVLSGSMTAPGADANRFGFGARHRGAENPVWDFHSFSWSDTAPRPLPLIYQFGSAGGRDGDAGLTKSGYLPATWNIDTQSLSHRRNSGSTIPGIADAGATANGLDATPGMPFTVRAQVTASGEDSRPLEFLPGGQGHIETGVTAGDLGIDGGNLRTIEAWAWSRVYDNNGTVWTMGNTGTPRRDWTLKVAGGQNEWVLNHWGSGGNDIWFTVEDSSNRWVHLAMVFDGTHSIVYVDGEEVARENRANLDTGNDNTFKIGWWHNRGSLPGLNGYVEEVRVWNVVRTEEEIRNNMFNRLTGSESGLAAYWPMNEGEGDTVFDLGPNGFHGTFVTQGLPDTTPTTPEWSENGGSRIGLSFLGNDANTANAFRFYWHPFTDELSIYGPGDAGVLDTFDFSGAANAPQYVEGASYTLEITGTYNSANSLSLSGSLTDNNGGEAGFSTQVDVSGGLPTGSHFGMSGRHPDVAWNGFQMGTPEQVGEPPVDPEGMTFAEWLEDQFGTETNPDIVGPTATPAGDGVANFLKYALGFPAMTPVSAADMPQPEIVDGFLQLTYFERRDGDVTYTPEMSLNLTDDWSSQNVVEVNRTTIDAEFDEVTVRATPPNGATRAFLQVTVRQN